MEISGESKWVKLKAVEATPESFGEYGQVVEASPDGDVFGPSDAQLDLSHGVPRFYIMNLQGRPLKFSTITHHASVTQCLGSIGGHVWYLGVAKPSIVESKDREGNNAVLSHCASGHFYVPPAAADVRAFKVTGPKFLKLNIGTWHAGPLFRAGTMDFYNLELSDTNVSFGLSSTLSIMLFRVWLRNLRATGDMSPCSSRPRPGHLTSAIGTWGDISVTAETFPLVRAKLEMEPQSDGHFLLQVVDHTTHNFLKENGVKFLIDE